MISGHHESTSESADCAPLSGRSDSTNASSHTRKPYRGENLGGKWICRSECHRECEHQLPNAGLLFVHAMSSLPQEKSWTALFFAVESRHHEVLEYLLETKSVDVTHKDKVSCGACMSYLLAPETFNSSAVAAILGCAGRGMCTL